MKRPLGITFLALWCFAGVAGGLFYFVMAMAQLWPRDHPPVETETWWEAVITHPVTLPLSILALTVFYLRLGWGLWRLENAARVGMVVVILLTMLLHLGVEWLLFLGRPVGGTPSAREYALQFGWLILMLAAVVYLFLPSTRRAFGQAD